MTKIDILSKSSHSFKKRGKVTCKVTSGSVTVELNGGNEVVYNADRQGNGNKFSKTKNDDNDPEWSVTVKKAGDKKAVVVFDAPASQE